MANSIWDAKPSRRGLFVRGAAGALAVHAAAGSAALAEAPSPGGGAAPAVDERFLPSSIDAATLRINGIIGADDADLATLGRIDELRKLWNGPPAWPAELVAAGTPGMRMMPMPPPSAVGETKAAGADGDAVRLLTIRPPGPSRGTYFFVHGGGWVAQKPDDYLPFLWHLSREAGVSVVAPQYRLAPEHPFPAGPDDVLAAARWLFSAGKEEFAGPVVIGGDSAGGHLAALTLQRLRDEHKLMPFVGADLVYGCYDFNLTPSVRSYGSKLPLSTAMVKLCVDWAAPAMDKSDPKISPLYGSVDELPPALFTVGTNDPLLDDTLFLERRWRSAGIATALAVYPGGVHGFDWLPLAISLQSMERRVRFLIERIAAV
jgi:acetyl esterase/lipase